MRPGITGYGNAYEMSLAESSCLAAGRGKLEIQKLDTIGRQRGVVLQSVLARRWDGLAGLHR